MKKTGILLLILLMFSFAFAGGIVTNTNQSADFTRTLNRNASTDLDAVYYNPAGLAKLDDGFHLYLSNQTISQTRTITSDVASLNSDTFEGTTFAPVFPNIYMAYKMDKLTFSAGFVPIGGGGGAEFEDGLPSFEAPVSALKTQLAAAGVTGYNLDIDFVGSSIYFGGQASATYKLNDMLSFSAGARFISASNSYVGHLKDIKVSTGTGDYIPGDVLRGVAAQYTAGAASAQLGIDGLTPLITGGAGDVTFGNLVLGGTMTQAEVDAVEGGLTQLGITFDSATLTPSIAAAYYTGAKATLEATAVGYNTQAAGLDIMTADIEVDAVQTGTAFAPILGANISLMDEKVNIGLRYEGMAALELENDTEVDDSGLFTHGDKTQADMPAMIAVGVSYLAMPSLRLEIDYNLYMNDGVDWDGKEDDIENGTEIGFGADFALTPALTLGAGYLISTSGALDTYHTDLSYSLNTSTMGFGAKYALNPTTVLSVGFSNTTYEEGSRDDVVYAVDATTGAPTLTGEETYMKTAIVFAFGIQKSF